jgi:cobalt/nickel transport system permease protein
LDSTTGMTAGIEHLPTTDSVLSRLDPRWKLAGLTLAAFATAILTTLPAALVGLAGAMLLALLARLPLAWYLARLGALALVLAFFVVLLPVLVHDGGPAWSIGPLTLSWFGLRAALLLCLKALAIVTFMLVLLASAPLTVTLKAAHALRVPGVLIQVAILTYRYIFVLFAELSRLRLALRVRGYRNRASRHSYRTVGHVTGILLVRGVERAERVSQAMRCRGFDGRFRSLASFHTSWADLLFFLVLVGGSGALWFWDHGR